MVRWELHAMPTRLQEPLPAIGNEEWVRIANRFIELYSESSNSIYTREEGEALQKKMDSMARVDLAKKLGFSNDEIQRMTKEERIMRWLHLQYAQLRSRVEPLAFQSPKQVLAAKIEIEAADKVLLAETGAKSSPFPIMLPHGILACRNFERRAKFIQTIEAIRDYASVNNGALPAKLEDLRLAAPNDPFTDKPFQYALEGKKGKLSQAKMEGFVGMVFDYELTAK